MRALLLCGFWWVWQARVVVFFNISCAFLLQSAVCVCKTSNLSTFSLLHNMSGFPLLSPPILSFFPPNSFL